MYKIFYPNSVAIVGISDKPTNVARVVLKNLRQWEYKGDIYGINPKGGEVDGLKLYSSVKEIPQKVDIAVILVPAKFIPQIMDDCIEKGIDRLAIPAGGFSEKDEFGEELSYIIQEKAIKHNIKFVGPNGLTVINAENGLALPFFPVEKIKKGGVSIISQSGGIGLTLLMFLRDSNMGLNKFISVGNKLNLDEVDFLEYLGKDDNTEIICMYLESVKRGKELIKVAQKIDKPILVFKGNTTSVSSKIALSHTAALSNDDNIFDTAMKKAGIIRVKELRELIEYAKVFTFPKIKGNNIVALSASGGFVVIGSDICTEYGFKFSELPEELYREMEKYCKSGVINLSNPIDMGDVYDIKTLKFILESSISHKNVDASFFIAFNPSFETIKGTPFENLVNEDIGNYCNMLVKKYKKPFIISLITDSNSFTQLSKQFSFPLFSDIRTAVSGLATFRDYCLNRYKDKNIINYEVNTEKVGKILDTNKKWLSYESFELLECYGIKNVKYKLIKNSDDLLKVKGDFKYPVVMKIVSDDILHKSDIGGVFINIQDQDELQKIYKEMRQKAFIDGVLIQEMIKDGIEVIIGAKRDEYFGPVIMFGLGGIFVEVLRDITFKLAPLTKEEAYLMIEEIKGSKLLKGVRGKKSFDIDSIIDCLLRVSQIIMENEKIIELDINPLIVLENGYFVVDCKIKLNRTLF